MGSTSLLYKSILFFTRYTCRKRSTGKGREDKREEKMRKRNEKRPKKKERRRRERKKRMRVESERW